MPPARTVEVKVTSEADTKALKETAAALDNLAGQAKHATEQANAMPAATGAAGKGARNLGGAVLEASRAFEDMQYGMRGVLNNIPGLVMMLGGTAGIAGAASVAAVAVSLLAPKLQALFGESEEDAEKAKEVAGALEELREKAAAAAAARGGQNARSFLDSLDDEEQYVKRLNDAWDRNLKLMQARRRAQMEVVNAQAALDLASIDADDSLSEEQKIRARAGIEQRVAGFTRDQKLADIADRSNKAMADAGAAAGREARGAADLAFEEARMKALDEEARALTARLKDSQRAVATREALDARLSNIKPGDYEKAVALQSLGGTLGEHEKEALLRPELERQRAEADAQATAFSDGDRARLAEIKGKGGDLDQTKKGVEELTKKLKALRDEAAAARDEAAAVLQLGQTEADAVNKTHDLNNQQRFVSTESAAEKAAAAARKKKLTDDFAEGDEAVQAIAERIGKLTTTSPQGRGVSREALARINEAVARLADGTDRQELAEVVKTISEVGNALGQRDNQFRTELRDLRRALESLKAKVRDEAKRK